MMKNIYLVKILLVICAFSCYAEKSIKPNVLFIAVDDLKPTIGAYGDKIAKTPNMDKLANMGTLFQKAYCNYSVCGPSRASLLTGLRTEECGIYMFKKKFRNTVPNVVTLPQHFKENGYTTAVTGKIYDSRNIKNTGKGEKTDLASWSLPKKPLRGVDRSWSKKRMAAQSYNGNADRLPDSVICNQALNYLDDFSKSKKPFFLSVGFVKPHLPFIAPKKNWEQYKRDEFKLTKFQKIPKGSRADYLLHKSGEMRTYNFKDYKGTDIKDGTQIKEADQKWLMHGYYACVSHIDDLVGKLLNRLKKNGQDKNTIICLWGDHGWHFGDHTIWGKHTVFEQATRVPMIIYSPFDGKAGESHSVADFLDVYPTLCELAGLSIPKHCSGKSLKPILENKKAIVKQGSISHYRRGYKGNVALASSYRTERYRYTEWITMKEPYEIVDRQLYDYEKDPEETCDYIDDTKYKDVIKNLAKGMREEGEGCKLIYEKIPDGIAYNTKTDKKNNETNTGKKKVNISNDKFPSLYKLYEKDFQIGAALSLRKISDKTPAVKELALKHFNQFTFENDHKWQPIHPKKDVWRFDRADQLMKWCDENDKIVVGHVFFWHSQCPDWVFKNEKGEMITKKELISIMENHVTTLVKRYKSIKTWDVVNEAVENPGYRKSGWNKILGEESIPTSFRIAEKLAPGCELVYNDFSTTNASKRKKIVELVKGLKKKKIRIDAVGMQSHWGLKSPSIKEIEKSIVAFASTGVKVHITELDIDVLPSAWKYRGADISVRFEHSDKIDPYKNGLPENIAKQLADRYEAIFKLFLKHKDKIDRVTFWGIADNMSWKNNFPVKGRTNYPLIFDRQFKPKEAAYRLAELKGWKRE